MLTGDLDPETRRIVEGLLSEQKAKLPGDVPAAREGWGSRALYESEQRFRMLVQGVRDCAIYMLDPDGRVSNWNTGAALIKGYAVDEIVGEHFSRFYTAEDRARGEPQRALETAVKKGKYETEAWRVRKDGTHFWASVLIDPIYDEDGTLSGFAKVTRDITERKAMEDQREDIARELDHRVRNLLSVVSSLVSLSARSAASIGEFKESLLKRLGALAATQDALRDGARKSIGLNELLLAELAQYRTPDGTNVIVEVPPIAVAPTPAQTLALAFHELATNSAKYGALSEAGGVVTVASTLTGEGDGSRIVVEWREVGGPPVKPPTRQGLGTRLITEVVKRTFRGDVALEYLPEGLVCRMTLPKAAVEAHPEISLGPPLRTDPRSAEGAPASMSTMGRKLPGASAAGKGRLFVDAARKLPFR